VAQTFGFDENDVKNNVDGVKTIINNIWLDFSEDLESRLFLEQIGGGDGNRNRMLRSRSSNSGASTSDHNGNRKLDVVFGNTSIENVQNVECPESVIQLMGENVKCLTMDGIIEYDITLSTKASVAQNLIVTRAKQLIQQGVINENIPEDLRDNIVFYTDDPSSQTTSSSFPIGAITGIAVGAALIGLVAGRALVRRRVRNKPSLETYDGLHVNDSHETMEEYMMSPLSQSQDSNSKYRSIAVGSGGDDGEDEFHDARGNEDMGMHDMSLESSVASSSNAGSSGWSSSAGISSLNTCSVDSTEYFGSSLAAIGAASSLPKKYQEKASSSKSDIYPMVADIEESSMSGSEIGTSFDEDTTDESAISPDRRRRQLVARNELDNAIGSGDWAAVGATAAILAQTPNDSFVSSDYSSSGRSSSISNMSVRDNERASELDRMVEMGDWEGVVLAAAKFEAESDRDGGTEGSESFSEGQRFLNASRSTNHHSDANSTTTPSVTTNISETTSNNLKRAEYRAEVEALVRRVVPDEIENVDEMMVQFRGREEELVETLRTMQERSIAARQREAMRKNAKREARKMAKLNKPPTSGRSATLGPVGAAAAQDLSFSGSVTSNSDDTGNDGSKDTSNFSTVTPNREALDQAIRMGDWEAVGRTAEQLGDGNISEGSSEYHSADESTQSSCKSTSSQPDTERAAELEGLIDKGDWSGVVAAANKYNAVDAKLSKVEHKRSPINPDVTEDSELIDTTSQSLEANNQENTLKEEEDALAQAEIWMSIAAQSKSENSTATKGAIDAADWAISRSYKQIQASSQTTDQLETQSVSSSNDGKSV